jgi:peptidyl-prolyl cis-trans isomerase C
MQDHELVEHMVRTWSPGGSNGSQVRIDDSERARESLIATDAPGTDEPDTASHGISVNAVEISARDINIESANYEGGTILERQNQAAIALVIRELLLQRAAELELPASGENVDNVDEDALIDQLLARELAVPEPDDASCQRYYDSHRDTFRSPDLFEVSHILIAADPRDEDARAVAREQASVAIQRLAHDPERFAELAASMSHCPSKATGGSLGQIGKGQTVPEFEDVLFRMQPGEISRSPVETRYGFHVIHLRRRIDGLQLDFTVVREQIAHYLRKSVHHVALRQYLRILADRADISGIDLMGCATSQVC